MRGWNERVAKMLFGVTPDDLVPARHLIRRYASWSMNSWTNSPQSSMRCIRTVAALDSAGAASQVDRPDGALFHSLRTPVLRAAAVRPAFQTVLGLSGRCLRCDGVQPQSQATPGARGCRVVPWSKRTCGEDAHLGRAFHRERNAAPSLGINKRFRPKDEEEPPSSGSRNPAADFHNQRRSNETNASKTAPEARLAKKSRGQEERHSFGGHLAHRESQRAHRRCRAVRGERDGRAGYRTAAHRPPEAETTVHAGR